MWKRTHELFQVSCILREIEPTMITEKRKRKFPFLLWEDVFAEALPSKTQIIEKPTENSLNLNLELGIASICKKDGELNMGEHAESGTNEGYLNLNLELGRDFESSSSAEEKFTERPDTGKEKQMSLNGIEAAAAATDGNSTSHACRACNMLFSTHQALGGHMTRHRQANEFSTKSKGVAGKMTDKYEDHHCRQCGAVFKTGPCLGGHMRKHYDKNKTGVVVTKGTTTTSKDTDRSPSESSTGSAKGSHDGPLLSDTVNNKPLGDHDTSKSSMITTEASSIGKVETLKRDEEEAQNSTYAGTSFDLNELPDM